MTHSRTHFMVRRRRGKALSPGVLVSGLLACGASEPTAARLVVSDAAYEVDIHIDDLRFNELSPSLTLAPR